MNNARMMIIGALVLSLIAVVIAGLAFGQFRSASDRLDTVETQVGAVETVQAEQVQAADIVAELRRDVELLTGQVAELTERVNQLTMRVDGDAGGPADAGEAVGEEPATAD